jgi:DNA-binding MarR family transcriptional regulator
MFVSFRFDTNTNDGGRPVQDIVSEYDISRGVMAKAAQGKFRTGSYEALADFRYALRRFFAFSEQAAGGAGLSPQQYQALLAILGARQDLGIGDIAERLMIKHHSAVELVNRLEGNGFVVRVKDPRDARRVFVKPTDAAEKLMEGLASAHLQELKGIRPVLQELLDEFDQPAGKSAKPDRGRLD